MNKKSFLVPAIAVVFILMFGGTVWADLANDCEPWNRPLLTQDNWNPQPVCVDPPNCNIWFYLGMDYVPQELGIHDTMYWEHTEHNCRKCHGNSLGDRHHFSHIGWNCTHCHPVDPNEPQGIRIEHDCTAPGCHRWGPEILDNKWHHNSDMAASENCIACHSPNLIEEITDFRDHQMYPPQVVSPTPFKCENCHWSQPFTTDHYVFEDLADDGKRNGSTGDVDPLNPGHPSTFDHYDMWGNLAWNDMYGGVFTFFEYPKPIYTNAKTHHFGGGGVVMAQCWKCHSQDPNTQDVDPFDEEYMRYCELCHSIRTLHRIGPHVQKHPGWLPTGFHVDICETRGEHGDYCCVDVAPTQYRTGDNYWGNWGETGPITGSAADVKDVGIYDNNWPDMDTSDNYFMFDVTYPGVEQVPGYYWGQVTDPSKFRNPMRDPQNPSNTHIENWASGHWTPGAGPTTATGVASMPDYYTALEQCAGCHGPWDVPAWFPDPSDCEADIDSIEPVSGSCSIHVTLHGYCFGTEHKATNGVVLINEDDLPGDPNDWPAWFAAGNWKPWPDGEGYDAPIHSWTNDRIEFEFPCWAVNPGQDDLTVGDYLVMVYWENCAGEIVNNGQLTVFTLTDTPTLTTIEPSEGPCGTIITLTGDGGFDPNTPYGSPTYPWRGWWDATHGVTHVIDLVNEGGTYTIVPKDGTESDAWVWTDTRIEFYLHDFFHDQEDHCADNNSVWLDQCMRNFVQDDGSDPTHCPDPCICAADCVTSDCDPGDPVSPCCPNEPLIPECDCLMVGCYNIYVKAIYYGDVDGDYVLSCGDTIYQVEKSDPVEFCVTAVGPIGPTIYKVVPRRIDCTWVDDQNSNEQKDQGESVHWQLMKLYGLNFGTGQGAGEVRIGTKAWCEDPADCLTEGLLQPYNIWANDLIKLGFVIPPAYESVAAGKIPYVWVVQGGQCSNCEPFKIELCDVFQ